MRKYFILSVLLCSCASLSTIPAYAADRNTDTNSATVNAKWAFGLQAAPLTFGLSLKYTLSPMWTIQAAITPEDEDAGVLLRVLRKSNQSRYWKSYLFAGIANGQSDTFFTVDDKASVATAGLGFEWSWQAKNPNSPPVSWSLELGLGYRDVTESTDTFSTNDDDGVFMALGAGLHYHFDL